MNEPLMSRDTDTCGTPRRRFAEAEHQAAAELPRLLALPRLSRRLIPALAMRFGWH